MVKENIDIRDLIPDGTIAIPSPAVKKTNVSETMVNTVAPIKKAIYGTKANGFVAEYEILMLMAEKGIKSRADLEKAIKGFKK